MGQNIIIFILLITTMQTATIFEFNKNVKISNWSVVDDVVMGGRSSSKFYLNYEGHGVFEGKVSLENNGGFSSVRYDFDKMSTKDFSKVVIKVKGDGKSYQFRVKSKSTDYYSYISLFKTSQDWQTIELKLSEMYPVFRGRDLDMPNYDKESIEEIAFLIGNKKAESFKLEIESIVLK
ncbi:complex I intermediate-associated protein 30 (CIA30) [Gillisia mitskevichiae]|uniref:Complex I intermediate-associated protein 30 (CIA30) n=1 Tax=Gillisia mitskevichiae TaxID=270921 RepID=A0A495PW21_9FLAO|nr:CIA30 family protein [Gillisia mitskevichiae]RKS53742.1 complex I intermediate-associated protein 30 (CIA30) [Gillisia mitskevichiae]